MKAEWTMMRPRNIKADSSKAEWLLNGWTYQWVLLKLSRIKGNDRDAI